MKLRTLVQLLAIATLSLFVIAGCDSDDGGGSGGNGSTDVQEDGSGDDDVVCTPFCDGLSCGSDGCGGSCGICGEGETCVSGACQNGDCVKQCDGKVCGPDGCGDTCGVCGAGETCTALGACEACTADCTDKVCGDDGCGGSCGACGAGEACDAGACVACEPKCDGKECGPDGCGGDCGTCAAGMECGLTGVCAAGKAPLGAACGPNAECVSPENGAPDAVMQEYFDCLNAQCATDLCFSPYCSKYCAISKDQLNNTTGAAGADGIDDMDAPSNDCGEGYDGLVGTAFRCVNIAPAGYQPTGICYPGTTMAACGSNVDCPAGESCALTYANGTYEARCQTNVKDGTGTSQSCNDDPNAGDVQYCANGFCFSIGCSAYCTEDTECSTGNACTGGTCANNADVSCAADADCSSWECKDQLVLTSDGYAADVCFPKACYAESECPDSDFYCRPFIADTMDKFEGSCTRKPADTVEFAEVCDENPDDNVPGPPPCTNPYMCLNGLCGGLCTDDGDCATDKDQKCTVIFEYDFDEDDDGDVDAYLPLYGCSTFPGMNGECLTAGDCPDGAEADVCQLYSAGPEVGQFALNGACIDRDVAKGNYGDLCGGPTGQTCNSGLCLGSDADNPGFCTEPCLAQTDCPASTTIDGQLYKSVCRSLLWGWNGTFDREDDIYLPVCLITADTDTLTDCSADYTCTLGEACVPFVIATNPGVEGSVDWLCVGNEENANIAAGGACEPEPAEDFAGPYCESALCMPDVVADAGYCSGFCTEDADCAYVSADAVCYPYAFVDRAGDAFDVIVPRCQKAATCIPCTEDTDCTSDYSCVNVGGLGFTADYRCAPTCAADGDCAGTDGGAACKMSKDSVGGDEGKMACIPANGTCL